MKDIEVMAERQLLFISPEGKEILSSLQIGHPYVKEAHGVCCDCEVPEILNRTYAAGVDGIQAILLTLSLLESRLTDKCSNGWRILWPDTREATSPRELFEAEHFSRVRNEN
jgi:hypothetical protein